MVKKPYAWANGAILDEHSKRKHKILREYFAEYLSVRCQLPQQAKFRLAIVDGFAGGGRYACGSPGSPLIFLEELRAAVDRLNVKRAAEGMAPIDIECLLILNDAATEAIASLKECLAPYIAATADEQPRLHLQVIYGNDPFEVAYPRIKSVLQEGRYRNVFFTLDQCGHSQVERTTIIDILRSFNSAEVFYTFAIQALLAFLRKANLQLLSTQLAFLGLSASEFEKLDGLMNSRTWLGAAERLVFETFRDCASYVSPFSINNPDGWRYWLIHFANSYRARQVYNGILHNNATIQAHFGRSGLDMLAYDPTDAKSSLYLFDQTGREEAKIQLFDDIPRLVTEFGDSVRIEEFYESVYKLTPAHMDDVHSAIIGNPDLEVITERGGERRKANMIGPGDVLRMKQQRSFFPMLRMPE